MRDFHGGSNDLNYFLPFTTIRSVRDLGFFFLSTFCLVKLLDPELSPRWHRTVRIVDKLEMWNERNLRHKEHKLTFQWIKKFPFYTRWDVHGEKNLKRKKRQIMA